jgi:hypothetical protein
VTGQPAPTEFRKDPTLAVHEGLSQVRIPTDQDPSRYVDLRVFLQVCIILHVFYIDVSPFHVYGFCMYCLASTSRFQILLHPNLSRPPRPSGTFVRVRPTRSHPCGILPSFQLTSVCLLADVELIRTCHGGLPRIKSPLVPDGSPGYIGPDSGPELHRARSALTSSPMVRLSIFLAWCELTTFDASLESFELLTVYGLLPPGEQRVYGTVGVKENSPVDQARR